jgi:hypothetical protein
MVILCCDMRRVSSFHFDVGTSAIQALDHILYVNISLFFVFSNARVVIDQV